MKEEMQKTEKGCHAETGTESRGMYGVQICMGITENNLVEVPIVDGDLLTHILSPSNMNHSKLIEVIGRTVKDGRVVSLIHKYQNAGVLVAGKYEETLKLLISGWVE